MEGHMPGADEQAVFLRCIGEPTRLQILRLLADREKCVGEIVGALNKEQSLVSHHLKALKECNIVVARQEAQKIYYRLTDPRLSELVMTAESLVRDLPLCQCQGVCHAERENQECRES
jgi:DNA-binding transcriptional ArsR family regulator